MDMLSNEKINFNGLEEKVYKDMMKLGREILQEQLRILLILPYFIKYGIILLDLQITNE